MHVKVYLPNRDGYQSHEDSHPLFSHGHLTVMDGDTLRVGPVDVRASYPPDEWVRVEVTP